MKNRCFRFSPWQHALSFSGTRANGFSLIELMVALAIASLVMTAIYGVYASLTRSYTAQNVAADIQQAVRAGVDFMTEDIMMAGLDPEESASTGIEVATSTAIRFTLDRNMNGSIDEADMERITYSYVVASSRVDQGLYETTGSETWEALLGNVTNLTFVYLDADGNDLGDPVPAAALGDIRSVLITMTVQEPAARAGMVDRTYWTQVRCRNLGL